MRLAIAFKGSMFGGLHAVLFGQSLIWMAGLPYIPSSLIGIHGRTSVLRSEFEDDKYFLDCRRIIGLEYLSALL
jgi:hypothetical protein